jgi:hypothetical protein
MHLLWSFQDSAAADLRGILRIEDSQSDEE